MEILIWEKTKTQPGQRTSVAESRGAAVPPPTEREDDEDDGRRLTCDTVSADCQIRSAEATPPSSGSEALSGHDGQKENKQRSRITQSPD